MSDSIVQYHSETIHAFKGIPTIECLPPRVKTSEVIKELADRPDYSEEDRNGSPEDRGMLVQNLLRLYQP